MSKFFEALEKAEQEGTLQRQTRLLQVTPTDGVHQNPTVQRQAPSLALQPTLEPSLKTSRSKSGSEKSRRDDPCDSRIGDSILLVYPSNARGEGCCQCCSPAGGFYRQAL